MKKWYLILVLCPLFSVSYGQIAVNDKVAVLQGSPPCINIVVCDGETGTLLEGATVMLIIAPRDTVGLVSDRFGSVNYYDKKFPRDSVGIIINYLGYEELRHVHRFSTPYINLIARLKTDSLNINSIIIKGQQIAMVIRGDTTIYNAGAFKTMRGDPLSELLKKLPGVEFRDGNVYANGQIVRRILVNGVPVFANYTNRAIELISAGDIEKVKVYDEHSARDIALGDTLRPKERVMDVTTKKKSNIVQQVAVQTLAGVYLDKNSGNDYETLYSAQGQVDRHMVGNNLMAMTGYGEKSSFSGYPTGGYDNDFSGLLIWDKSPEDYKYHIQSNNMLNSKGNTDYSNIKNEFFPTQEYFSREEVNEMTSWNRKTSLQSRNMFSYNIKKRHRFSLQTDITDDYLRSGNSVYNDIILNGAPTYRSNMARDDRNEGMSFNFAVGYKYKFAKPGRDLNAKIAFTAGNGQGKGWSIDTLISSTQKIYLYNDQNSRKNNYKGELSFTEPLTKKTHIFFGYVVETIDEKSRKSSVDKITGLPDRNSFDYTQNYLRRNISVRYTYRSNNLNINTGVTLQSLRQELDDKLPGQLFRSRTYKSLLPGVNLSYTKMPHLVEFSYSENVSPPSVEQLRGMLDTYNAPLYMAGNPLLKETVERTVNIKYSAIDFETFSSWVFNAKAVFASNAPVIKEEFFSENTVKQEFGGFEFPAGSILQTIENADGRFTVSFNADYSTKSKLLGSKISVTLLYSYDKIPCYSFDILHKNNIHTAGLSVGVTSDFSEKVELTLSSRTVFVYSERYERDYSQILRRINETVQGGVRCNFAERFWIGSNGSFVFSNTTLPGTSLKKMILNTEISYKSGKDYTNVVTLSFNDIFNQSKSLDVLMQNNYIQTRQMAVLGRNVYLKFSYCF